MAARSPFAALAVAVLLAGCLRSAPAADAPTTPPSDLEVPALELDVLSSYLAGFDVREGMDHCMRMGGTHNFEDTPVLPVQHTNGTNALLDMHSAWHMERIRLTERADFADDSNPYGDVFVDFHRHMLHEYDVWREEAGYAPLPSWDPATPIPSSMAYDRDPPCRRRATEDPGVEYPSWLLVAGGETPSPLYGYRALCDFPDLNRLGKEVDFDGEATFAARMTRAATEPPLSYHSAVHERTRGDFIDPTVSPRDPAFWAWHRFLDDQFARWEDACVSRSA